MSIPIPRIMRESSFTSASVVRHLEEHLFDRGAQANSNGSADYTVADIEFNQVRHGKQEPKVFIIQSLTCIDLEAEGIGLLCAIDNTIEFKLAIIFRGECFGE